MKEKIGLSASASAKNRVLRSVLRYVFLILVLLLVMFPFYWALIASFLPDRISQQIPIQIFPDPRNFTFANYREVFASIDILRYFGNTLIVTICNVAGTLLFSMLAAYGIEVIRFRGSKIVFGVLLAAIMIPGSVTVIPTYKLMNDLYLLDTLFSLILPGMLSITTVLFLRSFLMSVNSEMRESAQLDGAGELRVCFTMYAPVLLPALIAQGVFTVLANWNNYFTPMLYIKDETLYTMAVALKEAQSAFQSAGSTLASSLIFMLPMVVIFVFCQKYFLSGIRLTGIKG